jgi:enoyl-CoA hydratase/carnithine racemase
MASLETQSLLLVNDVAGIRTVALNRPARRNALSLGLMRELLDVLAATAADTSVHVVVLRGEGPAFCAGHDLGELVGGELDGFRELFDVCTELMLAVHRLPQPVIAQVHGIASAAGCQLVAACDLAVAADDARFATPGVRIGLFCSTPMVEVSRVVGRKQAMQLLLTGDPVDAATALQWGLVNEVVPAAELEAATTALAHRVARGSSRTLEIGKRAFYEQLDVGLEDAYALAKEVMAQNATEPDAQEGMGAFLQKREPVWQGRQDATDV